MLSWLSSKFKKEDDVKDGKKEEKKDQKKTEGNDMFSFGGKMAYKKQAETRSATDYDYLFKILLVGDSGTTFENSLTVL